MTEPRPRARRTRSPGSEPAPPSSPVRKPKPARTKSKAAKPAAAAKPSSGPRRIWVSGANGFLGKAVVRVLRSRGDEVIAPVRDTRRAAELVDMGVTVIEDDLSDVATLTEELRGVDAAIHAAGSYRVGISREERGAMWDANIGTTTRVLDAAEAAGTPKVVYVSTVNVFGNTHGKLVDESYRRNIRDGFLSWYDETKYGAHEVAAQRARAGAPVVTVMPGQVYGPGDHSEIGNQIHLAHAGKLPYLALSGLRLCMVHVDDLAIGIVAAMDRGTVPATYILAGPVCTLRETLEIAARLGGRKLPKVALPNRLLRTVAPFGRLIGQVNLREVVSASDGVSYTASAEKAARELGYATRSLEDGLRDTFESELDRAYTRA